MTPEWSYRAGKVLESVYFNPDDADEWLAMQDEFIKLQDALFEGDSYDDLTGEAKVIFDRAEKFTKDYKERLSQDTGGYGRFLMCEIDTGTLGQPGTALSADAEGHEHRGKGEGGGQFTSDLEELFTAGGAGPEGTLWDGQAEDTAPPVGPAVPPPAAEPREESGGANPENPAPEGP
jgi:hypothetical protein